MKIKNNLVKNIILSTTLFFCTIVSAQWSQLGSDIIGEAAGDGSGLPVSVSSDGTTVAIGGYENQGTATAAGHVRVYQWDGAVWIQKGADIDGQGINDNCGWALEISSDGNTLAIGSRRSDNPLTGQAAGNVRVFEWNGTVWQQKGVDIVGEAANDNSGWSVAMSSDGNTVAIGAINNSDAAPDAGHVRIYEWNGTSWLQKGLDIDGEAVGDKSGRTVSISSDGSTIAIGAAGNDGGGFGSGHVRVYSWNGTAWLQKGTDIDGEAAGDKSGLWGNSISADGNTLAIGATDNSDNGIEAGHVRIYEWNGASWMQKGIDIDGEAANDHSGTGVSLSSDGNTVAIGSPNNSGAGPNTGHVRVFEWSGVGWIQKGIDIDGVAVEISGSSVSLTSDGNALALGAPAALSFTGLVRVFSFCENIDITNSISPTVCFSYTVPSGDETYTASGIYMDTIPRAIICGDSILTIDLTISNISDLTTSTSGITILANSATPAYVWLDCDNNYAVISGETAQSYTPNSNGNYAVELTENGCIDTSDCVAIVSVGIIENSFSNHINVYPNPSAGIFSIDLGVNRKSTTIFIKDIAGKILKSYTFENSKLLEINIEQPPGFYILSIESEEKRR